MRLIESYIHGKTLGRIAKIGVLVDIELDSEDESNQKDLEALAIDLAMQIAATKPDCIDNSGAENVVDLESGRPVKTMTPNDLYSQEFIKNPEISVREYLKECEARFGAPIRLIRFERYDVSDT